MYNDKPNNYIDLGFTLRYWAIHFIFKKAKLVWKIYSYSKTHHVGQPLELFSRGGHLTYIMKTILLYPF